MQYGMVARASVQIAYAAIGAILLANPESMSAKSQYEILLTFHGPQLWGVLFLAAALYVLVEMLRGYPFKVNALAVAALLSGSWSAGIASSALLGHQVVWTAPIGWALITVLVVNAALARSPNPRQRRGYEGG